jgi:hypothetical protein
MAALGVPDRAAGGPARRESIQELIGRLIGDALQLLDHELALAALELKQHVEALARASVLLVIGGLLGAVGVLLLGVAGALAVGRAIGSEAGGYVIVGAVVALAGAIAVAVAKSRLASQSLAPTQTILEIRRDVSWMRHGRRPGD